MLAIAFQFSPLWYEYDRYVISRRVGTEKKDECEPADRAFLRQSIEARCNECERYSVSSAEFRSFSRERSPNERKRYLLLTATKKPRTIRNDHSRVTFTSFLTGKTRGIDHKTAACTIFFLLGHEIRCLRKEARRNAKKDEEKVYSSDGFPQGSRGWLFFSRSTRDSRSWSLKIHGAASLSRNQIFKDKAVLARFVISCISRRTKIPLEVSVKSNWRTQPVAVLTTWTPPSFSSKIVTSFRKPTIKSTLIEININTFRFLYEKFVRTILLKCILF